MKQKLNFNDEEKLINALKDGDNEALKFIYKEYFQIVKNIVLKYSDNEADVKDVLQDTIVALYKNLVNNRFKGNSTLKTYIYSIAKNISYKKFTAKVNLSELDVNEGSFEETEENQNIEIIKNCISSQLSNECKDLLNYFYFEKRSYKQISELMGYTPDFAKNKKARCMAYLKQRVKEKVEVEN